MAALRILLAALLLMIGDPLSAQAAPSAELQSRAKGLVAFFNGKSKPEALFSPAFLAQVPAAQVNAISTQLRTQLGTAKAVAKIEPTSSSGGTIFIDFERGTLQLRLVVGAAPPHLIEGLLITGTQLKGDTLASVLEELKKLPGQTSFAVARLGEAGPISLAVHEAARPLAIGSAFKLFILAELARSVEGGERKWTDIAALDRRSHPSGFLQSWPTGAPMTVYSLAALMISQSDNSATDTLLHLAGREKVEAILPVLGIQAAGRNRPFLSTLEAFALKAGVGEAATAWDGADEARRRSLLAGYSKLQPEQVPLEKLTGPPKRIESVEWFAAAEDLVRTMDWLRRNGGKEVQEILAINPGIGAAAAGEFDYLGYKGGSEAGVMNMTFLLRTKKGQWLAVAGSWNNPQTALDEARFVALMSRAVSLVR